MMEIQEIVREYCSRNKNPHRYRHIIGVRYTSICLAMRYGEDLTKASYAGLLHDCAKHMSGEKLLEKCRSHHLSCFRSGGEESVPASRESRGMAGQAQIRCRRSGDPQRH